MQCVGSARPTFITSASRICRYSTEIPTKRPLVKEWGGVVIPSRQEIQEKENARKKLQAKKTSQTDISYLKNAPQKSLAGRLARTAEANANQPKAAPISPEAIEAVTRRRREARLAREAEETNAVLRDYKPSPTLSKVLNAALETQSPLPQAHRGTYSPNNPKGLPSAAKTVEALSFSNRRREQVRPTQAKGEEAPTTVDSGIPTSQFDGFDLQGKVAATLERLKDHSDAAKPNSEEDIIKETLPPSQRELMSAAIAKRRDDRLRRRETVFARDAVPGEAGAEVGLSLNHREALIASIAKRREERLRRQAEEASNPPQDSSYGVYGSSNNDRGGPRRAPNRRRQAVARAEPDFEASIDADVQADRSVLPEFTGPAPVSNNLFEIFNSPTARNLVTVRPIPEANAPAQGDYSRYIPDSMKPLFSKPADELGPVNFAKVTLSHRAGISLQQRRQAIDIISQAFQPRSASSQSVASKI